MQISSKLGITYISSILIRFEKKIMTWYSVTECSTLLKMWDE